MITVEQIRAARAMLGLKQHQLAKKANVSMGTLNNIERGVQTDPKLSTMRAIQDALESDGIEFIGEDTGNRGVILLASHARRSMPVLLIIDDNDIDRDLYKLWLEHHPNQKYKVIEASDAKTGYETFLQHRPDVIILDFLMYGNNGFQLLVDMKKANTKIPPLVFITAEQSATAKRDAVAAGANAYIDKTSLTKEKLYAAIAKALD